MLFGRGWEGAPNVVRLQAPVDLVGLNLGEDRGQRLCVTEVTVVEPEVPVTEGVLAHVIDPAPVERR